MLVEYVYYDIQFREGNAGPPIDGSVSMTDGVSLLNRVTLEQKPFFITCRVGVMCVHTKYTESYFSWKTRTTIISLNNCMIANRLWRIAALVLFYMRLVPTHVRWV